MKEQTRGPRKGASALEFRSSELRAAAEEGVIEGYIAKWGQVDSYGTVFDKGAFTKTLRERANKVRALWNHEDEVGRLADAFNGMAKEVSRSQQMMKDLLANVSHELK